MLLGLTVAFPAVPAVAAGPSPTPSATPTPSAEAFDSRVREQIDRTGVPGAAYAVVGPNGVQHSATFGHDGNGASVRTSTPFLWGSVSKPVTATLVVMLARERLIDLDDPVDYLLPQFTTAEPHSARRITVRHLLNHTSGLPEGLELTDRYEGDRSLRHLLDQITDVDPVSEPGQQHSYSSLNYIVLAAVVEAVTGAPYERVLGDRLLAPAGMGSVLTEVRETEKSLPAGHRYVLGRPRAFTSRVDPATRAAGYLVGSLDDLAAFARLNLTGAGLLDREDLALLHTRQVETWPGGGYALGWRTGSLPNSDEPVIWHAGAAPGYQSAIIVLPEQDRAVVVLQNAYGPFHDESLLDVSWMIAASVTHQSTPADHRTDPLYVVMVTALAALAAILVAAVMPPGLRLLRRCRPRPRSRRGAVVGTVVWVVAAATTAVGLLAMPGLLGVTLGQVTLWAPDISLLMHVDLVLSALVALSRILDAARAPRG